MANVSLRFIRGSVTSLIYLTLPGKCEKQKVS